MFINLNALRFEKINDPVHHEFDPEYCFILSVKSLIVELVKDIVCFLTVTLIRR
jgi:hypothetical protein